MGVKFDVVLHTKDDKGNDIAVRKTENPRILVEGETISGAKVLIPHNQNSVTSTDVEFVCDNNCGKKLTWNQDKTATDDEELPDDAFRIVVMEFFDGSKAAMCSDKCAIEYLQNHKELMSPREVNKVIDFANYKPSRK